MIKAVLALCAVVGVGLTVAPAEASADTKTWEVFGVEADKKDPYLNIREKGRKGTPVVAKLPSGTKVELLETKGQWRRVKVSSGEHQGKVGWGYFCCLKPEGAVGIYRARISHKDHFNRKGVRLKNPAGIVQQDRANYHRFNDRDGEDGRDAVFHQRAKRDWIAEALGASLDAATKKTIVWRTPLLDFVFYADRMEAIVVEPGEKMADAK